MSQWYRNVGVDLGLKSAHQVVATDPDGRKIRFKCGHSQVDLDQMLARLTRDLPPGGKLRFVMEPTDTAWVSVSWYVMQQGHEAYLVSAEMLADFRHALSKHAKSDGVDGDTLSGLPTMPAVAQCLHPVVWGTREQETLKRLVKRYYRLAMAMNDRKKRIEAQVRLALPAGWGEVDLFSEVGSYLCSQFLNPLYVTEMGVWKLAAAIAPLASVDAEQIAQSWYNACQEALALYVSEGPVEYEILEWECRSELKWLRLEEEEQDEVREAMEDVYTDIDPNRVVMSAPGAGLIVAAAVVAAVGQPTRFRNARQFRAYTGMVPKVSRSGLSDSKGQHMTKAGPNWLKWALFLGADTARRIDPELGKVYHDQMVKYGHHHNHALCAVASRLAERLFVCYRENRPYDLRDLEGHTISTPVARAYVADHLTVPDEVRKRLRRGTRQNKRKTGPQDVRAS